MKLVMSFCFTAIILVTTAAILVLVGALIAALGPIVFVPVAIFGCVWAVVHKNMNEDGFFS